MASSSINKYAAEVFSYLGGVPSSDLAIDSARVERYADVFAQVEKETGVSRHFLAAIAWTESGFNASAHNSIGATGLMQVLPLHFAEYGMTSNPFDPLLNVRGGAKDVLAKGYGKKPLRAVMMGYNGLVSVNDPVKVAAFDTYFKRICARWAYLSATDILP